MFWTVCCCVYRTSFASSIFTFYDSRSRILEIPLIHRRPIAKHEVYFVCVCVCVCGSFHRRKSPNKLSNSGYNIYLPNHTLQLLMVHENHRAIKLTIRSCVLYWYFALGSISIYIYFTRRPNIIWIKLFLILFQLLLLYRFKYYLIMFHVDLFNVNNWLYSIRKMICCRWKI